MGLGVPRPDPLRARPGEISVAWLLLGHLCQDLGVLRKPREAGATELGGSVPFHLHIGLRLKTKLSDFRTFHSGKNNCTWGKTRRHFSKSSSRFHNVPKASGVDRFGSPRTDGTDPARLAACGPRTLAQQTLGTEEVMRDVPQGHLRLASLSADSKTIPSIHRAKMPQGSNAGRGGDGGGTRVSAWSRSGHSVDPHHHLTGMVPHSQMGTEAQSGANHPFLGTGAPGSLAASWVRDGVWSMEASRTAQPPARWSPSRPGRQEMDG